MKSLALAIVLLSTVALPRPASADEWQCRQTITARSEDATMFAIVDRQGAFQFALSAWTKRCSSEIGSAFCDFETALDKRVACNRVPNGFGGHNHTCTITGTPCRRV